MAATVAKVALSGGSSGKAIKVHATATLGTTIHTATSDAVGGIYDEIWLWAVNHDTTARLLTIEFGGVAVPDNIIEVTIPAQSGLMQVVPGLILQNSLVVTAFAASADKIAISGYVNRITN